MKRTEWYHLGAAAILMSALALPGYGQNVPGSIPKDKAVGLPKIPGGAGELVPFFVGGGAGTAPATRSPVIVESPAPLYGGGGAMMPPGGGMMPGMSAGPAKSKLAHEMSLEELLQNAVRNHGEILAAQARAREAEVEVYRIRQKTLGQIAVMKLDYTAALAIYEEATERAKAADILFRTKAMSAEEYRVAQMTKLKYKTELAKAESALASAAAVSPPEARTFLMTFNDAGTVLLNQPVQLTRTVPQGMWGPAAAAVGALPGMGPTPIALASASPASGSLVEKLQKALEKKISVVFEGEPLRDAIDQLRAAFEPTELLLRGDVADAAGGDAAGAHFKTKHPIPLGAAVLWVEEHYKVRFIVRDYGVVVTSEKSTLPSGAVTVMDIWRRSDQSLRPAPGETP